jgi:predicted Fe-Mo cluster-binding NifX family protein
MLIAVTTKSGNEIDQHFGHAEKFRIYRYRQGDPVQVDEVTVEKYCSFDPDHPFRHAQLNGIAEAIKDCRALVTAMIGGLPKQEMEKLGFKVIITEGPIGPALKLAHDAVCDGKCSDRTDSCVRKTG